MMDHEIQSEVKRNVALKKYRVSRLDVPVGQENVGLGHLKESAEKIRRNGWRRDVEIEIIWLRQLFIKKKSENQS